MSATVISAVAVSNTLFTPRVIVPVIGEVMLSIVASVVDALEVALNFDILMLPSVSSDKSVSCSSPSVSISEIPDSVIAFVVVPGSLEPDPDPAGGTGVV